MPQLKLPSIQSKKISSKLLNKKNNLELIKGNQRLKEVKEKIKSNTEKNMKHLTTINKTLMDELNKLKGEYQETQENGTL